ncbi:MAG: PEGA domain-containing protein [Myxococcales bacterium]|nr:PEGA domain-containing protein [Myxococcales bacterium]
MGSLRILAAFVLALLSSAPCAPASAADGPTLGRDAPPVAEERYQIGRTLYLDGHFAEAAAEFRTAFDLYPSSPRLAYNLARAEERAGRTEAAIDAYRKYLALAPHAADAWQVRGVVDSLERRRTQETVTLRVRTTPPGAAVRLDGEALGPAPVERTLPPGRFRVQAHLPGHAEASQTVRAAAGAALDVHLVLPPDGATAPAVTGARSTASPAPVLGWTVLGVGATALAVGTWQAVEAASIRDDVGALPPGERGRYDELSSDYDRARLVGGVGLGVGAAAVGVGLWLVLRDAPADVTVSATPRGGLVRGSF